ncbi:hypothetical protein ACSQOK_000458 [Klebsiella aerogenes]
MTDITRLLTSIKRRSAHVKEFGDDITFVKLEDLDALVEAVELARNKAADWEEKAAINYAERTAMIQHIGELESFRTAYMEWSDKTDWVQGDKRFDVLIPWGKHRADVLKAYIEYLELRFAELEREKVALESVTMALRDDMRESRTVTVKLPELREGAE